jgi:hypothetical protein
MKKPCAAKAAQRIWVRTSQKYLDDRSEAQVNPIRFTHTKDTLRAIFALDRFPQSHLKRNFPVARDRTTKLTQVLKVFDKIKSHLPALSNYDGGEYFTQKLFPETKNIARESRLQIN